MFFEKEFYKLLNKAMLRKTIENIRKRPKIDLLNTDRKLNKSNMDVDFY